MSSDENGQRLRVAIVDDEEPARRLLREYLGTVPGVEIVAECGNGFEAVKAVSEVAPELLLLDIQMPKLDGFEVLELIEREIAVIFVTAYDEHALRAFDVHAVDYLVKPFDADRLRHAVERARDRMAHGPQPSLRQVAADARPEPDHLERILVRDGARVHVIAARDVDYVEARDDAVAIHVGPATHLKTQRLAELEARLDPGRFVRVHRSFLVNLDRISRLELYAKDSHVAILSDGSRIPVSRAGYAKLRELL